MFGNTISILLATISLYIRNSSDSTFNVTSSSSSFVTTCRLSVIKACLGHTWDWASSRRNSRGGRIQRSLNKVRLQKSRKLQQLIGQTGFKICRICLTKPFCVSDHFIIWVGSSASAENQTVQQYLRMPLVAFLIRYQRCQ